ncbi:MAG: response regulator [Alphaproteobacteria bacterium]|nr:response regulator [Alphaproteobacteria bacterium]
MTFKPWTRRILIWLLLAALAFAVGAFYAAKLRTETEIQDLRSSNTLGLELAVSNTRAALSLPAMHLHSIGYEEPDVLQALNAQTPGSKRIIQNAFRSMLMRNPNYFQGRWLDETGMEIVRVDRPRGSSPTIVKDADLQDKSARGYFKTASTLGWKELYVSALDLNMEKGEIEKPFRPTVRLAIRVFDANREPAGIFILNVNASAFLRQIASFSDQSDVMLLNTDGYWLKAPDPTDEWGFMFGSKNTFGKRHPDVWRQIQATEQGMIETASGLWIWRTIREESTYLTPAHNITLKAVSHVPHEAMAVLRQEYSLPIYGVALVLFLIFAGGLYQIHSEITSRQIAEEEARHASRAKDDFLAVMSHEIRTPMGGVLGLADMLLDDDLPEQSRQKVTRLREVTKALLVIINDILDLSKLAAGKLDVKALPTAPATIANEVILLFYQTCPLEKQDKLQITAKIAPDFPAAVRVDPNRLRQILINLVGNAVKFTDEGSVTLECACDPKQHLLQFTVTDTGIGITPETIDRLFQNFEQGDQSVSRKYQGTGLGLSICKQLVTIMGGTIDVTSQPGRGSKFSFSIPYEEATVSELPVADQDQETPETKASSPRPLSVLVAEDNEINQMVIRNILTKMGHRVFIAEDGAKALAAIESDETYDLVLMDVRMPNMSGIEATEHIRKLPGEKASIPIVALTADLVGDNISAYLDAGMDDCVGKPIDPSLLERAIRKATNRQNGINQPA